MLCLVFPKVPKGSNPASEPLVFHGFGSLPVPWACLTPVRSGLLNKILFSGLIWVSLFGIHGSCNLFIITSWVTWTSAVCVCLPLNLNYKQLITHPENLQWQVNLSECKGTFLWQFLDSFYKLMMIFLLLLVSLGQEKHASSLGSTGQRPPLVAIFPQNTLFSQFGNPLVSEPAECS